MKTEFKRENGFLQLQIKPENNNERALFEEFKHHATDFGIKFKRMDFSFENNSLTLKNRVRLKNIFFKSPLIKKIKIGVNMKIFLTCKSELWFLLENTLYKAKQSSMGEYSIGNSGEQPLNYFFADKYWFLLGKENVINKVHISQGRPPNISINRTERIAEIHYVDELLKFIR
jgi:hypothetical protein